MGVKCLQVRAKKQDGSTQDLPLIKVPRQLANSFNNFQVEKMLINPEPPGKISMF